MKIKLIFFALLCNAFSFGQTTIFSETIGTVSSNTTIVTHESANGFDNDSYTMTNGGATNPADIRVSSASSGSGLANVFFTSTSGQYGFGIEGIDASSYTSLTLDYLYRKESTTGHATFAVEYWNGSSWVSIASTSGTLFNETATSGVAWYSAKQLSLPIGAQISGLKIRFLKSGSLSIRIDDIVLKGVLGSSCVAPTLSVTTSTTSITTSTTTLNAEVTAVGGGTNITERGFQYATNATLTSPTSVNSTGTFGAAIYNKGLTGLTANTLYYYRGYAINDCATPQMGYSHTSSFPTFTTLHNAPIMGAGTGVTSSSFTANWTAPVSAGSASFTYNIEVDDDSGFGSPLTPITGISSGTLSQLISGLSSSTTYYYRVKAVNAGGSSAWSSISSGILTLSPQPEIDIFQSATPIAHNGTQSFANTPIGGFTDVVFTVQNTGSAVLTFDSPLISVGDYTIFAAPSTSVAAGSSTAFTVRFTPTVVGTRTGVVTINNTNDSSEPTYVINLTGLGTPSNLSDVIANAAYTYNSNIAYASYQTATITNTSNSIDLFKFDIRDGGSSADTDALPTILSGITFNVTNSTNIRTAALFNGNTLVNATPTINNALGTISFSGLSGANVTAADGGTNSLTLRVSFNTTVTDNQQFQVTISNANVSAAGSNTSSTLAAFTSVVSTTTADRNRIEVTATAIVYGTSPASTSVNTNLTAFTIKFVDANNNLDFDTNRTVTLAASNGGVNMTSSPSYSITATHTGIVTFSDVQFTTGPQTSITITASSSGFTNVISNPFNITAFTYLVNDFRTKATSGTFTWSGTNTWEKYDGVSSWTASSTAPTSLRRVWVRCNVITVPSTTVKELTIENGGTLTTSNPMSISDKLLIQNGGVFYINGALTMDNDSNGATFEIEDNGTVEIGYLASNASAIWNGTEYFQPNSNFVIKEWDANNGTTANRTLFNGSNVSVNTYNGYTAAFGNISVDLVASTESNTFVLISSGVTSNLAHGNLNFYNPALNRNISILATGTATSGIGGDFYVDDLFSSAQNVFFSTSANLSFTIGGNMNLWGATTSLTSSTTATTLDVNINGDIYIDASAVLNLMQGVSANPTVNLNLKGDIQVLGSGVLQNSNSSKMGSFNFTGTGDGLTAATTQTIDIASTSATLENRYINFNIKNGAYVQLINRNFELGTNSKITVESGGIFDFGFSGTTPLIVAKSGSQTGTAFASQTGSTLKITSPDGITTTGTTGNVQVVASNITYNSVATFHYIGKDNQVTGDGIGSSASGKAVIVELIDNTKKLTPSQSFGITNTTNTYINGGLGGVLNIKKGQFVESSIAYITGSTGGLTMEDGTLYQIASVSATTSDYIPRLDGLLAIYNLANNSTIELNAAGNQILRGSRSYKNLTFSTSGTKTISSAVTSITGTVTVANSAILDVEDKTMGGAGTNLTMTGTSEYKTAGTGVKPDAIGTYSLGVGTKVTYTSGSILLPITTLEQIRLTPNYYNIDVVGNNVGTNTLTSPVKIQTGGTFKVKSTGVFKLSNTAGFNGSNVTAIDNTNSPTITLESGSTVEYAGANQTISNFNSSYYTNLKISGTGVKTLQHPTDTFVNENLKVSASKLLINSNEVITVNKVVDVTSGAEFAIESSGSLCQVDDASVNVGDISMKRNTNIRKTDYVYWSSPVNNFNINNVSPGTASNYIWKWNPTISNPNGGLGNWQSASGDAMILGKGYIVRGPNSYTTTPQNYTATFNNAGIANNGVPNNGVVNYTISRGTMTAGTLSSYTSVNGIPFSVNDDNWNLVGNPFPSAINVNTFLQHNAVNFPVIEGAVRIWTHGTPLGTATNPFYGSYSYNYDALNDYITYNGTATTSGPSGFNGFIGAGQGFMVLMNEGSAGSGTLTFNNGMRAGGATNNGQFYKSSNQYTNVGNENKSRIWIDLINASGHPVRTVVGYVPDASIQKDVLYDAYATIDNNQNIFSLIGNEEMCIQGRSLPFDSNDQIPLGIIVPSFGNYTIAIAALDGLFLEGQNIYLEDTQLNIIHNLKLTPYNFGSGVGTFKNRFILRYTSSNLNNDEFETNNTILVIAKNNAISIVSTIEDITSVEVYDILGREVVTKKSINVRDLVLSNVVLNNQALIVKIKLANGQIISRKVIL